MDHIGFLARNQGTCEEINGLGDASEGHRGRSKESHGLVFVGFVKLS